MNWLKRNMHGEFYWVCYFFGHKWVLVNNHARCRRCEIK